MLYRLFVFILFFVSLMPVQAIASSRVDHLSLAALMVRDGALEKAQDALLKVNLKSEKTDLLRFYTLSGLLNLQLQAYRKSIDDFNANILIAKQKDKKVDEVIYVYLAQAYFGAHDYSKALESIDLSADAGLSLARVWHLKSSALWRQGNKVKSFDVLTKAESKFKDDGSFLRKQVFLLIDMGLYQSAANMGLRYLKNHQTSLLDYLAIGKALASGGQINKALLFLEKAVLKFPYSAKAKAVLAHVYIKQKKYVVAADLMERAAVKNKVLLLDAAELRKKSGQINRALYLNSQVIDQNKKLKQRLALLLVAGRYDEASGMENDLYRTDLLSDESIRYALAYAFYRSGLYVSADDYLDTLESPSLFSKASSLRSAMEACVTESWKCLN